MSNKERKLPQEVTLPVEWDEDDDEEQKWDALFAQPHVQAGLSRLAEEAERQFALGETEEGCFGVERRHDYLVLHWHTRKL